jgi:hypothetical protein
MSGGSPISPVVVPYNSFGQAIPLNADAFGRLRVSSPQSLFDSKQVYSAQTELFDTALVGAGSITYQPLRSSTALAVAGAGDSAVRQSKRYVNYQPAKSQLMFATFVMTGGLAANLRRRVGSFDATNGIFLEADGVSLNVVRRTDVSGVVVDNPVPQASWNLDTMDGSGPSGVVLNLANSQILVVDFEWLGVGTVRIGFVINGLIIWAHEFRNANMLSSVYMRTPNLPVRWEVSSSGPAGALEAICCSVMSEGGQEPLGTTRSADNGIVGVAIGTTLSAILSIRLKAAFNRATVTPRSLGVVSTTNANARWALLLNPTFSGGAAAPVWASVATESPIERDVTRVGALGQITAEGLRLGSGYFTSDTNTVQVPLESIVTLASSIAGVSDIMVLAIQSLSGSDTYYGALNWLEAS